MSSDFNKCMFIGRLGKDPEVAVAQTGMKVGKFSLAVNEKRKDKEITTWINVITFDKLADLAAQYLRKGQRVFVEGRLQIRQYDRQDGSKGTATEVLVSNIVFLEKKQDAVEPNQSAQYGANPAADIADDDIPY